MTLDEAIKHAEEVAEEQKKLYRLCPASESGIFHCDGADDCKTLENGKNKGCLKCAEEHRQLAEWLKELKQLREQQTEWIPVTKRQPKKSGNYWCTFGGTNLTGKDYYTTESDAKEIFAEPEEYTGWHSHNVVAWMPLPESYKIESEVNK